MANLEELEAATLEHDEVESPKKGPNSNNVEEAKTAFPAKTGSNSKGTSCNTATTTTTTTATATATATATTTTPNGKGKKRGTYQKKAPLSEKDQKKRESLLEDAVLVIRRKRKQHGGKNTKNNNDRIPKGFMNKLLTELRKNECLADATRDTIHNYSKKKEKEKKDGAAGIVKKERKKKGVAGVKKEKKKGAGAAQSKKGTKATPQQFPQQHLAFRNPAFGMNMMNMNINPYMRMQMQMMMMQPNAGMMMPWNNAPPFPFNSPAAAMMAARNVPNNNSAVVGTPVGGTATTKMEAATTTISASATLQTAAAATDKDSSDTDHAEENTDKDGKDHSEEKEIRDKIFQLLDEDERAGSSKKDSPASKKKVKKESVGSRNDGTNSTSEAHEAALAWASREWMKRKLDAKNSRTKLGEDELDELVTTANFQFNLAPKNHIEAAFIGTNSTPEAHEAALTWASKELIQRREDAKNNNTRGKLPSGAFAQLIASANIQFNLTPQNHLKEDTVRSRAKRQNPIGRRKFPNKRSPNTNQYVADQSSSPKKRRKTTPYEVLIRTPTTNEDVHIVDNNNANNAVHDSNINSHINPDVSLADRFLGTFMRNRDKPMMLEGIRRRWLQLEPLRMDRVQHLLQDMLMDEVGTTEEEVESIEALFIKFEEWSPTIQRI